MRRFSRAKYSDCKTCPLRDQPRIYGEYPSDGKAAFALIGESPGEEENEEGRPFIGPAGRYLNSALHEADLPRHKGWISNLIPCRPPHNELDSDEGQEALVCCKKGFDAEVAAMIASGVKVIVPLGTKPLHAFGIEEGITKARGSVYDRKPPIVPTFHPSFILRGMNEQEGTWIGDFKKIKDIVVNGWSPPKEHFTIHPSLAEVESFVKDAVKKDKVIAVDLETTGFRPEGGRIVVIGLADGPEHAISVPFLSQFGKPYWSGSDENAIRSLIQLLCKKCVLLFQNGLGVDLPFLTYNGFKVERTPHDVIVMHHTIHPELPHSLGYIVSVYGSTPYWKGEMLNRLGSLLNEEDNKVRTYNLRDSVVLHQVFPDLKADLEEYDLWKIYNEIGRELILPVLEMEMTGLLVDQAALKKWNKSIRMTRALAEKRCREIAVVPSEFEFTKDDHLRLLIYGDVANQFAKAQHDLDKYEANPKLRKDTKKYKEIETKLKVLNETVPLFKPKAKVRTTDTGKSSVKEEFLIARKVSCLNRLAEIRAFKKKTAVLEKRHIERTVGLLDSLFRFNEFDKLVTTYSKFPVWKDGRIHPSYKIQGTNTGRLSSSGPNAQNFPEDARQVFISKQGWSFVGRDYSNLEVWVHACASDDEVMLKLLLSGKNIHDVTVKEMFGVDEKHPEWKSYRMAEKKYRFGKIQYNGTLRSIYEKIMLEVPDLSITFHDLDRADRTYMTKHPKLAAYVEKQMALCDKDPRIVENAFGRKRVLLGSDADVLREALNTPTQGTAADIVNKAMIRIYKRKEKLGLKASFVLQVHDELVMEVRDDQTKQVDKIMKEEMEKPVVLWGHDVTIPTVGGIAKRWSELK